MIEACETNSFCEINNCKEIRCEMQKISVGDIVCKTNSYWKGELGEPPLSEEDKKEKFKVVAISRLGCQIESLETGHTSAWWGFDCLKLAERG